MFCDSFLNTQLFASTLEMFNPCLDSEPITCREGNPRARDLTARRRRRRGALFGRRIHALAVVTLLEASPGRHSGKFARGALARRSVGGQGT